MTRRQPSATWCRIAAVALVLALLFPVPAGATAGQETTGSLTLLAQTSFRVPGQPFLVALRLRTSSPTSGLEIAVGVYRRLGSRSEFVNAVDGRLPARTPIDLVRAEVDGLPRDAAGNVGMTIEPRARQQGVYPVRVELRETDGGAVIDGFTTFLITVPAAVDADPLEVALVLPVHAPPSVQPDGDVRLDEDRAAAITELAGALVRAPRVPVSLVPTPETIEAMSTSGRAADRDGMTALARATSGRQVLTTTYVPTDVPELLDAGLRPELSAQLQRGTTVIESVLGTGPTSQVRTFSGPIDAATLRELESQGVSGLVAPESAFDAIRPPNNTTLVQTFAVDGASPGVEVAAADDGLAAHFDADLPAALGAAYLLADLSVLWLDLPGRAPAKRGAVAMPARTWVPQPAFLDIVFGALADNPILQPVTLDRFFGQVGTLATRGGPVVRSFAAPPRSTTLNTTMIRSTRRSLEAFASIVATDNPTLDLLDRTLLTAQSLDLRAGLRTAYLRGVSEQVNEQLDAIAMPAHRSITLTAREGELPVTITNELPYPISVVLTLESDTLDFPSGASRRLELTRQNTTERFAVQARGSGSFPVRVRVSAPEGTLLIAESRFTVRSTAVSGVGIALSVGAALFLVVWWASHLRSRRKAPSADPA